MVEAEQWSADKEAENLAQPAQGSPGCRWGPSSKGNGATKKCLEQKWGSLGVRWQCAEHVAARLLRMDLAGAPETGVGRLAPREDMSCICCLFIWLASNWINDLTSYNNGNFSIWPGSGFAKERLGVEGLDLGWHHTLYPLPFPRTAPFWTYWFYQEAKGQSIHCHEP